MLIKGCIEEDFTNYKKPSMFIIFPYCDFKCDKENHTQTCQNWPLSAQKAFDISIHTLVSHYTSNPITRAIVCGGLEPLCSVSDLLQLIEEFRKITEDDIVIYTGYTEEELTEILPQLSRFKNIIIKFGRFRPNQPGHLDPILGVTLASPNQYAKVIS